MAVKEKPIKSDLKRIDAMKDEDQGKGYQTRINAILRAYYDAHAK